MTLIHCNFFSDVLGLSTAMDVILPQTAGGEAGGSSGAQGRRLPTLYLLHGLSDDHTIWQRRTSIERYVEGRGLAVVMPAVGRSFYTDAVHGLRYWTFLSEELPAIARSLFPLSAAREDTFAAGLSMGGYGAFKLALRCPEKFAAAASLSGSLDLSSHAHAEGAWRAELEDIFGNLDAIAGSDNDLLHLAETVARASGPKPRLYQWCGTEDFLCAGNVRFRDYARRVGLDLTYEESPGSHEWSYWDRQIQRVLEWLPLQKKDQ